MTQSPELLRRLLRAKDRMDGACHEEWLVERLAEVSAVSAAHFARSLKRAFGVPPHRYLRTRRIERAVALLRDTDLSISDIAFQTGWKCLGTFWAHLSRHHGRESGKPPNARAVVAARARARARMRRARLDSTKPPLLLQLLSGLYLFALPYAAKWRSSERA